MPKRARRTPRNYEQEISQLNMLIKVQGDLLKEQQQFIDKELARIEEASLTDELTGVLSRKYLAHADKLFSAQERNEKFLAVIFIDVDNFKTVNDTCGHKAGDEILIRVAAAFQETTRGNDAVIRLGGDEFLIIATNVSDKESLLRLSERLHEAVKNIRANDCSIAVTLSVGICFVGKTNGNMKHTLDEAMGLSDKAMYVSKKTGKSRTTLVEDWTDLRDKVE